MATTCLVSLGNDRTVKYNVEAKLPIFLLRSSTLAMAQLSRLPGNTLETGRWFFQIDESTAVRIAEKKCYNWYQQQPRLSVPPLPSCPCSIFQARWDRRFRYDWRLHREFPVSFRGLCYINRWNIQRPQNIIDGNTNSIRRVNGRWTQRCCYSNDIFDLGFLLEDPERGGHARLQISPPISSFLSDEEAYKACCVESELCNLFYTRRPSDDCRSYLRVRRSMLNSFTNLLDLISFGSE